MSEGPEDWLRMFEASVVRKLSGKRAESWENIANKLVMMGVESPTTCYCYEELRNVSIPHHRAEVEKFHQGHLQYNAKVYKIISDPVVMTNMVKILKKDLEYARKLGKELGRDPDGGQGRITSAQHANELLTHFLKSDPSSEWVEKTP